MLEKLLVALLVGGHVLLEGVPGLAKTLTIRTLARVLGGSFSRVQFTPDLVPADLVGTRIWRPGHRRVPDRARPRLRQPAARRRDQPRAGQGPVRAARGHAGAAGHARRHAATPCRGRSSCSRRRTRSSPRAPTSCPRPSSTASSSSSASTTRRCSDEAAVVEQSLEVAPAVREVMQITELERFREIAARVFVDRRVIGYTIRLADATRHPEQVRPRRARAADRVRRLPARADRPRPGRPRARAAARPRLRHPARRARRRRRRAAPPPRALLRGAGRRRHRRRRSSTRSSPPSTRRTTTGGRGRPAAAR